jgi:hypothetical protein
MFALLNEDNICVGHTSKGDETSVKFVDFGLKWTGSEWIDPKSLDEYKAEAVQRIKLEAHSRIQSLDWKVTRAKERIAIGADSEKELTDVYTERDAIRAASDQAEIDVMALDTIEAVKIFKW